MNKTTKSKQNFAGVSMIRLARLPVIKWKMGRLRERSNKGWSSPIVWWVRETEAKQRMRELKQRIKHLESIIKSAQNVPILTKQTNDTPRSNRQAD